MEKKVIVLDTANIDDATLLHIAYFVSRFKKVSPNLSKHEIISRNKTKDYLLTFLPEEEVLCLLDDLKPTNGLEITRAKDSFEFLFEVIIGKFKDY